MNKESTMVFARTLCCAALGLLATAGALAGDCSLNVTRTACPGQEKESFSKCGGSASCVEKKPAASAAQCVAKAKEACANARLTTTKNKKLTAEFDGVALEGGRDFCVGHPDYPYANKPDCK
jgi:hypothetical protein